jgi:hypothetical protein
VQDVQHLDRVADDPIENQVIAVHTTTDAGMFVTRHEGIAARYFDKRISGTAKFSHERKRTIRILPINPITGRLQLRLGGAGENELHRRFEFADARYLVSNLSKTSSAGFTRPASASAMPRAMAASNAAGGFRVPG